LNFLEIVRGKRQELANVLSNDDYSGIRELVEDLYHDRAHFLFELLQNAEDAGATEVWFYLQPDRLIFEHDGRPFDEPDVWGITNIGKGTKRIQDDKIGRFGIGFKAVFAYSETPHIWSPTLSFKITELVLPWELPPVNGLDKRTRFEFPFNNLKKPAEIAYKEVEKGLSELPEITLLFLSHLKSVNWQIDGGVIRTIVRTQHSQNHFEILIKQSDGKSKPSSHFLKFDRPVQGLEKQKAAVAFELAFLEKCQNFDVNKPLAEQMKIISAYPGQVAVFFPAQKEVSRLRFHIHAPYVTPPCRSIVTDTPANLPLFDQLADLAAACLHQIYDLSLLTTEFLEVLPNRYEFPEKNPNSRDIDHRYDPIYKAIINEMKSKLLTPTQSGSHAPAKHLVQGKASLKSLLSDEDLEFLLDYEDEAYRWAVGVRQKNSNADRFMESLSVKKWDVDDLVKLLINKTALPPQTGPPENISPEEFTAWLSNKSVDWHQELYALLLTDYLMTASYRRDSFAEKLGDLKIVRLTDGKYGSGLESYFVTDGFEHDAVLGRVDARVYSTGKSKTQKENARALLEEIGVREVGDAELVEAILNQRYTREASIPDDNTYNKDFKRFVDLVEKEPETASLFAKSFIFKCGDCWRRPDGVFLDQPLLDTGLNSYYAALGDKGDRFALCESYQNCGISMNRLAKFAQAVGAAKTLEIQQTTCHSNPNVQHLALIAPGKWTRYGINVDYHISGLDTLLKTPNAALSQLVWRTLCDQGQDSWMTAKYRNNRSYSTRSAPSQVVCVLRRYAWVPQTNGRFVRPSEATRDGLPAGFAFDTGWTWLEAIQFGQQLVKESAEQLQRQTLVKQLGFNDEEELERAKRFAALPADDQLRFLADRERHTQIELPEHEPANPSRRAERVLAQAANAPERLAEERTRSVSVALDVIKQKAGEYLRQQYTNRYEQMICQVCKDRLPFKLDDGSDYFERVELLCNLKRHHQQNYLALCPNHAAMFMYAKDSTIKLQELIVNLADDKELPVVLARKKMTIYFTQTHLADLKAVIRGDLAGAKTTENESPDTTNSLG
jgi:hypothetical protein